MVAPPQGGESISPDRREGLAGRGGLAHVKAMVSGGLDPRSPEPRSPSPPPTPGPDAGGGCSPLRARKRRDSSSCDACPHCNDVCPVEGCKACSEKLQRILSMSSSSGSEPRSKAYTLCEIRRHNHPGSCWLVAHGRVYDATFFAKEHPAGSEPILKRAGKDVSRDFDFHSNKAINGPWKKLEIGHVVNCKARPYKNSSCSIM